MENNTDVICPSCNKHFMKDSLVRSCGNCFACTACEIYICPLCRNEIVVKPMKKKTSSYSKEG
jgi:hypothetical protein